MLKVASHNLADALSNAEKIPAFLDSVKSLNPDVLVMPEAYAEDKITYLENVEESLGRGRYSFVHTLNQDSDGRQDRHGTAVLYKTSLDVRKAVAIRLATRNALQLHIADDESDQVVNLIGAHLDDRHEASRLSQVGVALAGVSTMHPSIFVGDLNAMNKRDRKRLVPRLAYPFARLLPAKDPVPGEKITKLERLGSLSQRLGEMALGTTIELFISAGMEEVGHYEPTMMLKGRPLFNLDHILSSRMDAANFQVDTVGGLSDHCRISADMRVCRVA